ncbi:MAG: hypothetical protein JST40_08780 [Armatimonadetes bacterium]|nr:hypothetical protein [Armatimonadota bacterium]
MRLSTLNSIQARLRMRERRLALRPMMASEITDMGFLVMRELGLRLLRLVAVPTLLAYAVFVYFGAFVLPGFTATSDPGNKAREIGEILLTGALTVFVGVPLIIIAVAYSSGIVTHITLRHLLGEPSTDRDATRMASRNLGKMLGALAITSSGALIPAVLAVLLLLASAFSPEGTRLWDALAGYLGVAAFLMTFLVFPYVATRTALAPSVIVEEGLGARAASKRSSFLLAKNWDRVSGYDVFGSVWVLCFILFLFLGAGLRAFLALFEVPVYAQELFHSPKVARIISSLVEMVPGYLVLLVLIPIWCVICAIVYVDRRIRLEGLDIEVLSRDAKLVSAQLHTDP